MKIPFLNTAYRLISSEHMKKVLYFGKYRLGFSTGRNSYFFVKIKIILAAIYQGKITVKKIDSSNAGEHLWLRVERQTIRKLKGTGAILFTIRIHLRQLKHIVSFDGIASRLSKALSALPPEMQAYKQTDMFADSAQAYLDKF